MLAGAISSVEWGEPCVSLASFGCGSLSLPSSSGVWAGFTATTSLSSLNFTRSSNLKTSTIETPNLLFSAVVCPKSSVAFSEPDYAVSRSVGTKICGSRSFLSGDQSLSCSRNRSAARFGYSSTAHTQATWSAGFGLTGGDPGLSHGVPRTSVLNIIQL